MGDLTRNISRQELLCHCGHCGFDTMDWQTINFVQATCDHFAEQLSIAKVICHITSAARCLKHNKNIGSTDTSQHLLARAIDFWIEGVSVKELYDFLDESFGNSISLGLYEAQGFVHADSRTINRGARWTG